MKPHIVNSSVNAPPSTSYSATATAYSYCRLFYSEDIDITLVVYFSLKCIAPTGTNSLCLYMICTSMPAAYCFQASPAMKNPKDQPKTF